MNTWSTFELQVFKILSEKCYEEKRNEKKRLRVICEAPAAETTIRNKILKI